MRNFHRPVWVLIVLLILALSLGACNLTAGPDQNENIELTDVPTNTPEPTRTSISNLPTSAVPTSSVSTALPPFVTRLPPTSVVSLPPTAFVTNTPSTISILIISPAPGNVVSGNVQVIGSAVHPNFLQYALEYGPDPNPGNLWFPIGTAYLNPVLNGVLGIWSTNAIPDGVYQLRLRVFLRDGTSQQTVVNNIRVQNTQPTPVPTNTSVPRPIAAFSVDRAVGQAPLTVRFTNQSTGLIDSYLWEMGDGSVRSRPNPRYTFQTPGTYTVRLTVVGPGGQSNVTRQIRVQSPQPPVANFTADRISGEAPLTINFTDASTGNITSYEWNFGDGSPVSTERSPSHTYTTRGTYNVILTVQGPGGSSFATRTVTVEDPAVPPPVARFTPTQLTGLAPLTVNFDSSGSTGQIDRYRWDFGDGTNSTDANPIHQYSQPGTYNVTLSVFNDGGQSIANGTITVERQPQAPEAAFEANPTSGRAPLDVRFTSRSTGEITGYAWDFDGDGNVDSDQANPNFRYEDSGTYTVTLTVFGQNDLFDAEIGTITVTEPLAPPDAQFVADPTSGNAPLLVTFTNQSSGDNITSTWDFGDGTTLTSNEPVVTHEYGTNGVFDVRLTVTGPESRTDSATAAITVTDALQANFEAFPATAPAGLQMQFNDRSSGNIVAWSWEFGDGTGTSGQQNPQYTYSQAGTYDVTLTVVGGDGREDATTQQVVVIEGLSASISANPTTAEAGAPVQFSSTTTGDIVSYSWAFGDGQTSSEANPTHIYQNPNTYEVRLTVTGGNGETVTSDPVVVTINQGLSAAISANPASTAVGETVQFTSNVTGNVTGYAWDFDDGTSSDQPNPSHTYQTAGTYNVRLTVTGQDGRTFTSDPAVVTVSEGLSASISANPTSVEVGNPVQFTSSTTGDVTGFNWAFGDGQSSTDANPTHSYQTSGSYNVTLTVSDANGNTATSDQVTVTVTEGLSATIAANPNSVVLGNAVQFTSTTTGNVASYSWNFGDGQSSSDIEPVHVYQTPGNFEVVLTVTGQNGDTATSDPLTVTVTEGLSATITANPNPVVLGNAVQFTSTTTGNVASYSWNFGDGQSSSDIEPVHVYQTPGNFEVILTVTDADGNTATSDPLTVTVTEGLSAAISADPTSVEVGVPVQFNSTTTGNVASYSWNFGDGASSAEPNPTHSYAASGDYNVTLTVTGADGNTVASDPITVTVTEGLGISISADPTTVEAGTPVQFNSTVSGGDVSAYAWDFGDGVGSSAEANPVYTYADANTYEVTLTVVGTNGIEITSDPLTITVEAAESAPADNLAETTEVMPDIAGLANRLSEIVNSGTTNPNVFSVAGGRSITPGFLNLFGDGDYVLNVQDGIVFQPIVDRYLTEIADGQNSFNRDSAAVSFDLASDLLNQPGDLPGCDPNESALACELRLAQPAVLIISTGLRDAITGTDPETFRSNLQSIVETSINNGTIPLLLTLYPRTDIADQLQAINNVIIEVAEANDVPVVNIWRALNALPNSGVEGGFPSTAGRGADVLNDNTIATFGENARNYWVLRALERINSLVLGG